MDLIDDAEIERNSIEELQTKLDELYNSDYKNKLDIVETVLLLLSSYSEKAIINRTLLFKEIFLVYEELIPKYFSKENVIDPNFFAHHYGPYSIRVAQTIMNLFIGGYIEIQGRNKGLNEKFKITEKGLIKIRESLNKNSERQKINSLFEDIKRERVNWDELQRDGILAYVYQRYPKYAENSRVKKKYGELKWGELLVE